MSVLTSLGTLFDVVLAGLLVAVSWRALSAVDVFQSIVLFVAFGLLTSLVWVRLAAPDLALAEAAIGSGVSGALFLAVHGALQRRQPTPGGSADERAARSPSGLRGETGAGTRERTNDHGVGQREHR